MVVAPTAGEAPVKPIDVWVNQTQKRASLLGQDSSTFWRNDNMDYVQYCITTPQRPICDTFGTVAVRDFWENGCMTVVDIRSNPQVKEPNHRTGVDLLCWEPVPHCKCQTEDKGRPCVSMITSGVPPSSAVIAEGQRRPTHAPPLARQRPTGAVLYAKGTQTYKGKKHHHSHRGPAPPPQLRRPSLVQEATYIGHTTTNVGIHTCAQTART